MEKGTEDNKGDPSLVVESPKVLLAEKLESYLFFVRKYLSAEEISYAPPEERKKARRMANNVLV